MISSTTNSPSDTSSGTGPTTAATVIGVIVLLGFAVFIVYLLRQLSAGETEWSRAMVLFGGVEAVAFAAAGYFFGTQVQRGKVGEAQQEAQAAKEAGEAAKAQANAERKAGDQLARRIIDEVSREPEAGTLGIDPDAEEPRRASLVEAAEAYLRS